ncbi:MAG: hypothetical protein OIF38_07325 [Cellvibrionaceae bacterium]|nr:hypothetical protein [Cellvibrionaceae bacterium]
MELGYASASWVSFLFAVFCAYWAIETRRNAWLWFFCGFFFSVLAGLALLYKHGRDKRQS